MQNIILLHGALGSEADLAPLSSTLKQKGFSVYSFSFTGHGKTALASEFDILKFAQELKTFINSQGIVKPCVFGYSMGGYVALQLAFTDKNLIHKLITLGTKFDWSDASVAKETKQLDPELMLQKVPAFAKMLEEKHGKDWKELLTKTAGLMHNINQNNYLTTERFSQIETPVLIGLGDKDKMVSLDETRAVYTALPNAAMFMIPNTKHPLETADVDLLSTVIKNFVSLE